MTRNRVMSDPFDLPPEDVEYLDANHPGKWRIIDEDGKRGLLIEGFDLPVGYTQSAADLMILMPSGYPGTPLDMFYFDPPLAKQNGEEIAAVVTEQHFVRLWQRWSRHYEWNPGEDSLHRHIEHVRVELKKTASE